MNKIVTAVWCGPCKSLKASLEAAKVDNIEYIDADKNMEFCAQKGIKSIPTLITENDEIISDFGEIIKKLT